jgi:hypothetical protein
VTAKPTAERVQALRERREALGLIRLELYVHPDDAEAVKKYAATKRKARMRAGELTASDIYQAFARGPSK